MNNRETPTTDAPILTMGLRPNKPILSWKYKSKMHVVQLTYQISKLSLAYLKGSQNVYIIEL